MVRWIDTMVSMLVVSHFVVCVAYIEGCGGGYNIDDHMCALLGKRGVHTCGQRLDQSSSSGDISHKVWPGASISV